MKLHLPDMENLYSEDPKVKYGTAKTLLQIAAGQPALLYDEFPRWISLMNGSNSILKWTAIDIIGRLSAVDQYNVTDKQILPLLSFLHGGNLITANHAIFALGLIAQHKPEHRARILRELLLVCKDKFETEECKAIATGKVIETLGEFVNDIRKNKDVLKFIQSAQKYQRNATRKKAAALLKKIEKANLQQQVVS